MRHLLAFLLTTGLAAPAVAQQTPAPVPASDVAPAPELTEAQRLQLRVLELQIENLRLQAALAQAQLDAQLREGSAFVTSLQREGFTLTRGEKGWAYVPTAAKGATK